jgi:hypothetical protein
VSRVATTCLLAARRATELDSTGDYYEVLVEGAGHGDFSDMTFLMAFMKWLGANGPLDAMRAVDVVNAVSLKFFDAYLRDGPKPRFDVREFPELRVTMSERAVAGVE